MNGAGQRTAEGISRWKIERGGKSLGSKLADFELKSKGTLMTDWLYRHKIPTVIWVYDTSRVAFTSKFTDSSTGLHGDRIGFLLFDLYISPRFFGPC
jgi:hypothetical protein